MGNSIKMRAKVDEVDKDVVIVKALVAHPMETGQRTDSNTGEKIPAHYITRVTVEANGEKVFSTHWGTAVSTNPYLSFKYRGGKAGDMIKFTWIDNKGETDTAETVVK